VKPVLFFALLSLATLAHAQQQTGASGGIPVPPVPEQSAAAVATPEDVAPDSHSFRIRLLDGRSGNPIAGGHVKLWYDEPTGNGYIVSTNAHGVALMPAPIGEPLRILVHPDTDVDCRRTRPYDPPSAYPLADIAQKGAAAENTCGNVSVRTSPGELVLFVRPQRWYDKLNRNQPTNVP
jgi:hypothetical protein